MPATHLISSVFLLGFDLPDEIVDNLNNYLDNLIEHEDRQSHAGRLVGQIKQGQQLTLDFEHPQCIDYSKAVCAAAGEYINKYEQLSQPGIFDGKTFQVEPDEVWSVHSYAGDYNPLHDHGTKTVMGVSTTTWTKVPPQITDRQPEQKLFNASGVLDGHLSFVAGASSLRDPDILKLPQTFTVKPEVGKLYVFPSWLSHMVYPFEGEGERRTIASNLNVHLL
jgi:hypothetical protein